MISIKRSDSCLSLPCVSLLFIDFNMYLDSVKDAFFLHFPLLLPYKLGRKKLIQHIFGKIVLIQHIYSPTILWERVKDLRYASECKRTTIMKTRMMLSKVWLSWSNRIRTQAHQYTERVQFLIPIWLKEGKQLYKHFSLIAKKHTQCLKVSNKLNVSNLLWANE